MFVWPTYIHTWSRQRRAEAAEGKLALHSTASVIRDGIVLDAYAVHFLPAFPTTTAIQLISLLLLSYAISQQKTMFRKLVRKDKENFFACQAKLRKEMGQPLSACRYCVCRVVRGTHKEARYGFCELLVQKFH